jgi:NADH-quinone oxidoreductase subunit C
VAPGAPTPLKADEIKKPQDSTAAPAPPPTPKTTETTAQTGAGAGANAQTAKRRAPRKPKGAA